MTEADLCDQFIALLPDCWTAYNETAGFDILLVHDCGIQIGIEAKLTLNSKVLAQVIEGRSSTYRHSGPDFRAVLVDKVVADNTPLARALGITVVKVRKDYSYNTKQTNYDIHPRLPELIDFETIDDIPTYYFGREDWYDEFPMDRCGLPEYIPDVRAGMPSPKTLGHWKIQAIKMCIWIDQAPYVTRNDFQKLGIDPGRWMTGYWLVKGKQRGQWVKGNDFPLESFKSQHPRVFEEIEADFDKWSERLTKPEGILK